NLSHSPRYSHYTCHTYYTYYSEPLPLNLSPGAGARPVPPVLTIPSLSQAVLHLTLIGQLWRLPRLHVGAACPKNSPDWRLLRGAWAAARAAPTHTCFAREPDTYSHLLARPKYPATSTQHIRGQGAP